jgi:exodeoxyribonuclease V alpha subunit
VTHASLEDLRKAKLLGPLDEHCARALCRIAGDERPSVLLAAAVAVRQIGLGHVCTDLHSLAERHQLVADDGVTMHEVSWPDATRWLDELRGSPVVGGPSDAERRPLVLDAAGRLYLRRYHEHEQRLAHALRVRAAAVEPETDRHLLEEGLSRLFARDSSVTGEPGAPQAPSRRRSGEAPDDAQLALSLARPDEQRDAARRAATRRLCVISGGPGTGKTSTVVKILALLVEQRLHAGRRAPRVLLLAPTGKAAMRLSDAIRRAKSGLACSDEVRAAIPDEAATIHRALGSAADSSTRFRHDAGRPLRADVVLVDEASMVDLALMARLVDAVPHHARLILLGDKDQLASVEAGAVLGELCSLTGGDRRGEVMSPEVSAIAASTVELTRSYRYRPGSGIEALANAINRGEAERALQVLSDPAFADVERSDPEPGAGLSERLRAEVLEGGRAYLAPSSGRDRLAALERFRVLCAHRSGPHGVVTTNAEIEALLAEEHLVDRRRGPTYAGRPIIITRNDYQLQLFNGDVGTIVEVDGKLVAAFVASGKPGETGEETERHYSPARLPPHETVFAMTIHKSQGSEFDHVAVLLGDRSSPLLTRELLYTAVTRARKKVTLYATGAVIAEAVARRTERGSGLRDALRGAR